MNNLVGVYLIGERKQRTGALGNTCSLYTSDAADDLTGVDSGVGV